MEEWRPINFKEFCDLWKENPGGASARTTLCETDKPKHLTEMSKIELIGLCNVLLNDMNIVKLRYMADVISHASLTNFCSEFDEPKD